MTARNSNTHQVKKTSAAVSGQVKQLDYKFIEPKVYDKIVIQDDDVIEILDVKDENGDRWYEVPYLAQDTIQESIFTSFSKSSFNLLFFSGKNP